ncbi:MAG TPA: 50S ribosomal protein L15 [Candidatus Omnitrophota bacterium]|nr:50S ribosomal protein L15 [Candidatus Omnitrophota bacterium]MDD5269690.1 50S ribosomal protein L15 [Candidatus Omnitrophota bacterium]MDD5738130.1 50S ribosomal protein L15 [Candidatus Omnitrophota bacterium]HOX09307.1 50S ribosomal protein L15 [Candidatus Omnitrophota bacterium]HRZ66630.1 50S ribosomal protein L15 [Candidatus Omnitrophota bacterium]
MKLGEIRVPEGATKRRKIVGRGPGSGHGKTSTRGQKGQRSRSGAHIHKEFEGGQMPLIRTVPKRGFTNRFKKISQVVNLTALAAFKENSVVTPVELCTQGIIRDEKRAVKILGDGEISKALTVKAQAFSTSAAEKIAKAGGKTEIIK